MCEVDRTSPAGSISAIADRSCRTAPEHQWHSPPTARAASSHVDVTYSGAAERQRLRGPRASARRPGAAAGCTGTPRRCRRARTRSPSTCSTSPATTAESITRTIVVDNAGPTITFTPFTEVSGGELHVRQSARRCTSTRRNAPSGRADHRERCGCRHGPHELPGLRPRAVGLAVGRHRQRALTVLRARVRVRVPPGRHCQPGREENRDGRDLAGNTTPAGFSVVEDSTAPTGVSLSYPNATTNAARPASATPVAAMRSRASQSVQLERRQTSFAAGVCNYITSRPTSGSRRRRPARTT